MNYTELRKINVNDHVEKKNGLSYLSWAWAVDQLLQLDETATWEYSEPKTFGGDTVMVFCTVTAFGKSRTAQLPVMNYKNQAIMNPDAFAINTAMQRCLAKAISLHGIGLYIYAGEDLPEDDGNAASRNKIGNIATAKTPLAGALDAFNPEQIEKLKETAAEVVRFAEEGNWDDAFATYDNVTDNEERVAIWSILGPHSAIRSQIKKIGEQKRKAA